LWLSATHTRGTKEGKALAGWVQSGSRLAIGGPRAPVSPLPSPEMKQPGMTTGLAPSDVERYLARLGVSAPDAPTSAALGDLLRAHVRCVPFENLLIQLNQPSTLRPAATAARIARGGGGYCFELNGAFGALLASLGFDVRQHEGRCWIGNPDPLGAAVNHLALTVRCVDGSWWFSEVGMSDAVCEPIPLEPGRYSQGPFDYRLEAITGPAGPGWRFHHDPHGSFGGMDFYPTPARVEVIQAAHRRLSTSPKSPFTRLLSVGRRDLSGADILRGRVLIRWDPAGRTHRSYDDSEEWFALLATDLGLPVGGLPAADREALWRRVCEAHAAWNDTHLVQDHAASVIPSRRP
jgi:N-hydroxyarylamine O-acetyltransferase